MAKRPSKAARAAMKAAGVKRQGPSGGADVYARLAEIDPSFGPGPARQLDAKAAADFEGLVAAAGQDDPWLRAEAVEALGRLGDGRAIPVVRERLRDSDGEVRTHAAVALIRIGDEQLFPEVVKALRHEDPRVVIGAAVALGRLADRRVVPNLVEAFKTEDPEVGAAVAWALGQCGDPAALPWLLTALEQGFATANVCEALGRIGDAKATPALLRALGYPADDTRAYAARSLGLIWGADGSSGRAEQLQGNKVVPALREATSDAARKVRLCAAIALYEMGEKLGGETLVDELNATSGPG